MSQSPHMVKDSISGADYFLCGFSLIRQPDIRTFVLIPPLLVTLFSTIPVVNLFVMPLAICGATAMWVDHYRQKQLGR